MSEINLGFSSIYFVILFSNHLLFMATNLYRNRWPYKGDSIVLAQNINHR